MPASGVESQSVLGGIFSAIIVPFKLVLKALIWVLALILKILLFPFTLLHSLFAWIWGLRPVFYIQNLYYSCSGLLRFFIFVFLALTVMLLVLSPFYIISVFGAHRVFNNFDFLHALITMVKTFAVSEGVFLAIAGGGFLVSALLAFVFFSITSPLQTAAEFSGELTEQRIRLILMFFVAVTIFAVLYLILKGIIPI